jgi:hypothetical protein
MNRNDCILIFGEDDNDRRALIHLIQGLLPEGHNPKIEARRRPIILSRQARARLAMSTEIGALWRAERRRGRSVLVVVHRDCDAVEPAHVWESEALKKELHDVGVTDVVAATPAWEIETWWMLFPEALARVRGCWRAVDYSNREVGRIEDAKERLRRDLRPIGQAARNRCPDFTESDGIRVAQEIRKGGLAARPSGARCSSFETFKAEIRHTVAAFR